MEAHTTCTIITAPGIRCGAPAVTTFESRSGEILAECAEHEVVVPLRIAPITAESIGLFTRSTQPFVLVAQGRIVGYAESESPAVLKRAAKLRASVMVTR